MNDRDFKKWKPFNSVVPSRELLKRPIHHNTPDFNEDIIEEFEEKIKTSYYLKSQINIYYLEKDKVNNITGIVVKIDLLKKNITIDDKTINFRQIIKIK